MSSRRALADHRNRPLAPLRSAVAADALAPDSMRDADSEPPGFTAILLRLWWFLLA